MYILFLLKYKYIVVCKYVVINDIGMLIENRLQIREKVIKEQIEYFLEFIMFLVIMIDLLFGICLYKIFLGIILNVFKIILNSVWIRIVLLYMKFCEEVEF